jgi:chaperonin GroES
MIKDLRPLHDRVLLQRVEEQEEKTVGGIIIPDAAKEKSQVGKVLAVGPGKVGADGKLVSMTVKVGDLVLFSKYAGTDAGDDRLVVREDDILGIVSK